MHLVAPPTIIVCFRIPGRAFRPIAASRMIARKTKHSTSAMVRRNWDFHSLSKMVGQPGLLLRGIGSRKFPN